MKRLEEEEAELKRLEEEEAELRNETEQMVFATEKALKDLGEKVTESEKKEIEELVDKTKKSLE